jgi:PAS domain S-box-containing protein
MANQENIKQLKKIGEDGYVNQTCWLAKNVGRPPSKRCQYCQLKFRNCLFNRFLIISAILIIFLLIASLLLEGRISKLVIISIFVLVIVYGYFFDRSTESIVAANFEQRKAKESLEELTKNLQQKVEDQTKDIRLAFEAEKIAKEKIDSIRVEDEAILSSIGDGVIAVNKTGEIMFMNESAEQMLGLVRGEAIGKKYKDVLSLEDAKGEVLKEKCLLYDVLNFGKKIMTKAIDDANVYYYIRKDKTRFPVAVTGAPIILNGEITGAVDIFRDITIERQIDKSKTEFVSLVSHQLRTPLSAIRWYSDVLIKGKHGKLSVKQKKYLKEIQHGNERMIKLIDVMLNVSRLDAGKIKNNPVQINVKKLVEDIVKEQKFHLNAKKQKFVFDAQKELPEIYADSNLVRMIFQNLISNAIKYTQDGGKITCSIKKDDTKILFQINDNGIGIPKEQQNRVFEKLFRANNAFSQDPEGNGLGLYVVKTAVEEIGGKIWFQSEEGKGTTFFVNLPFVNVV